MSCKTCRLTLSLPSSVAENAYILTRAKEFPSINALCLRAIEVYLKEYSPLIEKLKTKVEIIEPTNVVKHVHGGVEANPG